MVLFALLTSNSDLPGWFIEASGLEEKKEADEYYYVDPEILFSRIEQMGEDELRNMLKDASLQVSLNGSAKQRELMATHLGVDISSEFSVTEEYLNKKNQGGTHRFR